MVQGIPTTRAGSIVTSDTMIVRDPLYTGDPIEERASVLLRIAPTFFRFGSFEIFNHTDIKTGTQPQLHHFAYKTQLLPSQSHICLVSR